MSSSSTKTTTYTVADVRRVVENFAADFSMIAQATGLRTQENVERVVFDLKVFAEEGFLEKVQLSLDDSAGEPVKVAIYEVSESAGGWQSERPGNNLWPNTPRGSLTVTATLVGSWYQKSRADQLKFMEDRNMFGTWPLTDEKISLEGLSSSAGQRYASSTYGWARTNYSR